MDRATGALAERKVHPRYITSRSQGAHPNLGPLADARRERPTASRETGYTYSTAMSRANAIAPECCINARDGILERNASVGVTRYALRKNPHTPTLRLPTPCRR